MHAHPGDTRPEPLTRRALRAAEAPRRGRRTPPGRPRARRATEFRAGPQRKPPSGKPASGWRGLSLRSTVGLLAAAFLVVPYALPSYAEQITVAAATAPAGVMTGSQSVAVPDGAALPQAIGRDGFRVTKAMPAGVRAYAQLADTFVNDEDSPIQWPFVRGVPISSWFGYRVAPCAACSSDHKGLDMNPGFGTPIQAMADGVVTEVGNPSGEYGVYAIIDHVIDGQRYRSVYAHMDYGSLAVQVGDRVEVGDLVGQVGNSGLSTGAHLHFELRQGDVPIDPYAWLKARVGS